MSVRVCSHLQVLLWLLWYTPHTWLSELLNSSCILCKSRFISRVYLYLSFADSHLWEKHTTKVENTKMLWSCIIWTGWSKKLRIWSTKRVRTLHFLLKLLIAPKSGAWSSTATFSTQIHFHFFDSAKFTHLIMHYLAWLLSFPASSVRTLKQLSTKRHQEIKTFFIACHQGSSIELQQRSFSMRFHSSFYSCSIQDGSAETRYAPSPYDASTWHDATTHGNATSR